MREVCLEECEAEQNKVKKRVKENEPNKSTVWTLVDAASLQSE